MPKSDEAAARLARDELIGHRARIAQSNDPSIVGREGTVVDETLNTLILRTGKDRFTVGKRGQRFAFTINDRMVLLDGDTLRHRPEDRIKKARVDR